MRQTDDTATASQARIGLGRLLRAEPVEYFLLLGTTLLLVLIGIIMVLSSSSVTSYLGGTGFFGRFQQQGLFALIGIPIMLVFSRLPVAFWKRWAWAALLVGFALQLLVYTPLGYETGGNRNWIRIGTFTAHPSEAMKLALVVWLAYVLSTKRPLLNNWKHALVPAVPVAALSMGINLIGGDLGTVIIMLAIVLGALYFADVRWRILAIPIFGSAILALLMTAIRPNRVMRVMHFFTIDCTSASASYSDLCWQPLHGTWALSNGGVLGVGLGQSKSKWSWLPAADNDYIFAVIGEELGLIGAVLVLILFVVLAVLFIRIIRFRSDPFGRVVTGAVMTWILSQAFVNIAVVLGFLPVLGVPLPLVSSGGTALVTTLAAVGVVLSIARNREEAPRPLNR